MEPPAWSTCHIAPAAMPSPEMMPRKMRGMSALRADNT